MTTDKRGKIGFKIAWRADWPEGREYTFRNSFAKTCEHLVETDRTLMSEAPAVTEYPPSVYCADGECRFDVEHCHAEFWWDTVSG